MAGGGASEVFFKGASQRRDRRWALVASYACLTVFVIFFLFPPY